MTTIVADLRAGVMVSDSCVSEDFAPWVPGTKVFRVNGDLFGFSGDVNQREKWLKWHRGGRKTPRPKLNDFTGLLLRPDGVFSIHTDGLELHIERGFHAIGSGAAAALGAMLAGADAKKAVEIACQIDNHSRGDICVFELKEKAQ